jgi:WD40 repeat protein
MNLPNRIKPFLITLSLCCAAPLSAADPEPAVEPVAWHVPNAELRVPVKVAVNNALLRVPVEVAVNNALLRMPPQVYIADLKPLEITGELAFDPKTKSAIQRDARKPEEKAATIAKEKERYKKAKTKWDPKAYSRLHEREGGPIMRVTGSATYAIKPEYKYFSCWSAEYPQSKIFIDGKPVRQDRNVVTIPTGAKTLKIEARDPHLRQAGFITRSPRVTHSAISLPGHDPTRLVPVVHRASGQRVGCRTVWAEAGEPMSIMFDSSSGDQEYWVYLVDQAKKPARLDWAPQADLIQEVRQLDRYDPELETLAGFEKLWESAATFGRGVPSNRVINEGTVQFRSKAADGLSFAQLALSQPVKLKRISGIFQIPATGSYRLLCMNGPGGYVLLDGQLIATFRGAKIARLFEIEIDQGEHRIEFLQYSPMGQVGWAALWWKDPTNKDYNGEYSSGWPAFGGGYKLWEPRADAAAAPLEYRTTGARASFRWYHSGHLWAVSPGHDLNWYRFSAHAPGASTEAVYRWRFDDGRTAEGKQVMKLFLRAGMRKVQLEVQDAPGGKVIARAAGEVSAQLELADWNNFSIKHDKRAGSPLQEMIWAFMEEDRLEPLPLDDLVNLYEWSYPLKHWRASWKLHDGEGVPDFVRVPLALREAHDLARRQVGDMLAMRVDELIAAYPYSQLLQIAQSLSHMKNGPTDARYAAAEKLLATVLERAPAGSSHWRAAALALADIRLSVRGKTEFAAALLEKFSETEPAVDMSERWQFAEARKYHHLADTDQLAGLTVGLDWSPITRPRHSDRDHMLTIPFKNNRGFWLARDFDLPAGWKGNDLVFHAGLPPGAQLEHVWMNGQPLGRMWQWQDENIVIPAKLLKKGGKNRITWLLQPYPWPLQAPQSPPTVSADLSHTAYSHDHRIQLVKGRHSHRDLGQQLMVGVLNDSPRSLAFSPDGKQLASGHQYGSVRLWDVDGILEGKEGSLEPLEPGAKRRAFVHTGISIGAVSIVSLAFSPDGKRLAAGSEDYRITILDTASGKVLRSFVGHAATVVALAFSTDGKRLASASHDRSVKIWDTSSGKELLTLGVHAGPVHAVAYSPDGKSIATAIDNAHIRLWDATTGKALRTLEGQQGEVLSLAFSPDGKQLVAGYRESVVSQWDLESGKKLTTSRHGAEQGYQDAAVTKVLYSLDGKQLVSLGGASAKKWNSDTGSGGEQFVVLDAPRIPQVTWHGPREGPDRLADGFEKFPVELYTTKDCEEQGMKVASFYGKWEKLPDFEALKPVKKGVLRHIDRAHLMGALLPYWKTTKKDGREQRTYHPSGLKFTGYLKIKKAGDYTFSFTSDDDCRLVVGSETVIETDGLKDKETRERGVVHLEPGVHPLVLTYSSEGDPHHRWLDVTFPNEFVRSLTVGEIDSSRLMAGTLLAKGKPEEAKVLLTKLHRGRWPLSEREQEHVEQTRMRIRRMAGTSSDIDHGHAMTLIESSLVTYPMLSLDPEFMVSAIAVYATLRDPRAAILAEQMLEADMNDGQRRLLIMTQVKIKLNAGDLPAAGQVYRKLKKLAPQSDETIEARELIKAAVIKGK